MEEFVFKKWDYGLKSLDGYISRRHKLPNLSEFKKFKLGITKNNIPIYRWNFIMWFKLFMNERRERRKINEPLVDKTRTRREMGNKREVKKQEDDRVLYKEVV